MVAITHAKEPRRVRDQLLKASYKARHRGAADAKPDVEDARKLPEMLKRMGVKVEDKKEPA